MASTNKTSHYELSQYVGSDKPTYLTDYNGDMLAIDNAIYGVSQTASTASSTASSASESASSANSKIGTLSSLTTNEKSNVVGAVNEVNYNVGLFNLTTYKTLTWTVTTTTGTAPSVSQSSRLYSAVNATGSIGKIYGEIRLDGAGTGLNYVTITSSDTGLRPSSDITLDGLCLMSTSRASQTYFLTRTKTFTLKTDGTIEITGQEIWNDEVRCFNFVASLIFASDFGDTPVPEN